MKKDVNAERARLISAGFRQRLIEHRSSLIDEFTLMKAAIDDVYGDSCNRFNKSFQLTMQLADEINLISGDELYPYDFELGRCLRAEAHAIPLIMKIDTELRRVERKAQIGVEEFLLKKESGYNLAETLRNLGNWIRHKDEWVDRTDKNKPGLNKNRRFFDEMNSYPSDRHAAAFILSRYGFPRYIDLESHLILGVEWTLYRRVSDFPLSVVGHWGPLKKRITEKNHDENSAS